MDYTEKGEEEIDWIEDMLLRKLQRGDEVRHVRILVDRAYARLMKEFRDAEYCERDFDDEYQLGDELKARIEENPSPENVLPYAILLFYYPLIDLETACDMLWKYGKDDWKCMLTGSFYYFYFKLEGKGTENAFQKWLFAHMDELDHEIQALVYMFEGVGAGLKKKRDVALHYFKKALEKDQNCAAIYQEIQYFARPYSKIVKEAESKERELQKKISLRELENMSLEERNDFSFFLEMEIKRNIKRETGFQEEWK